ncbi:hypothetical protein ZWY2020_055033 [Hordeum vulgare]|nr:hypothetical protein ZWY2020_055033 [Hordeum vulgare]
MSPAVAPPTAASGPDPPAKQPPEVEIITMRVAATTDSSQAVVQACGRDDNAPGVEQARHKDANSRRKADRELRGWLMVLATVIASITYASGLNPPSGFQGGDGERVTPVRPPRHKPHEVHDLLLLQPTRPPSRCLSPSCMLLVASEDLRRLAKVKVLEIIVAMDVLALLMAYIVGSTFRLKQLGVCAGLVLVVPVALIVMSSRVCGRYFWDEL